MEIAQMLDELKLKARKDDSLRQELPDTRQEKQRRRHVCHGRHECEAG